MGGVSAASPCVTMLPTPLAHVAQPEQHGAAWQGQQPIDGVQRGAPLAEACGPGDRQCGARARGRAEPDGALDGDGAAVGDAEPSRRDHDASKVQASLDVEGTTDKKEAGAHARPAHHEIAFDVDERRRWRSRGEQRLRADGPRGAETERELVEWWRRG